MINKSAKLPIFIVCGKSPFESHGGGYGTYALGLAETLSTIRYRPTIVALGKHDEKHEFSWGRLTTCRTPFSIETTALPFFPLYSQILAKRIANLMYSLPPTPYALLPPIIWCLGPWAYTGVLLKRKFGSRITLLTNYFTTLRHEWIAAAHGVRVADYGLLLKLKYLLVAHVLVPFLSRYEREALLTSEKILTNYQSTEKILTDEFHIPQQKFFRTGFSLPGVSTGGMSRGKPQLPSRFILTVCRQDPRKGVNVLLHAMELLKRKGNAIPLIIVGDGPLLAANKRLSHRLGLDDLVTFTGYVDDIRPYFQRATLFCLPSFEEGAGALVINEAMAAGLPIVATNVDGIPEDMERYENGRLVPPGDATELAHALLRMIKRT